MMRLATYNDKVVMNVIIKIGFNRLCPSLGGLVIIIIIGEGGC